MKKLLTYLMILIVLLAVIGVVAGAGLYLKQQRETAARTALTDQFGADILALCTTPPKKAVGLATGKYLVIDTKNQWIYQPYQDALGSTLAATSKQDVATVVCLAPSRILVETCSYGSGSDKINRYQSTLKITRV